MANVHVGVHTGEHKTELRLPASPAISTTNPRMRTEQRRRNRPALIPTRRQAFTYCGQLAYEKESDHHLTAITTAFIAAFIAADSHVKGGNVWLLNFLHPCRLRPRRRVKLCALREHFCCFFFGGGTSINFGHWSVRKNRSDSLSACFRKTTSSSREESMFCPMRPQKPKAHRPLVSSQNHSDQALHVLSLPI